MQTRILGRTGLRVSVVSFGAGPVSGLMTGDDAALQTATVRRALQLGVNWFDTAPGYGQGQSEAALGRALSECDAPDSVCIATKVRLRESDFADLHGAVQRSVDASERRLARRPISLVQLHNAITRARGDEPDSVSPADVLEPGGILDALTDLRHSGRVRFLGLTGTGQPDALRSAIRSGGFDTIQTPYHLLNPSAGQTMPPDFPETDYGNVMADCAAMQMGVFAIRVFAAGALLDRPPSAHTLRTPYFPLALYERDRARAAELADSLPKTTSMKQAALHFVLSHPSIHSAIVGVAAPAEIEEVAQIVAALRLG